MATKVLPEYDHTAVTLTVRPARPAPDVAALSKCNITSPEQVRSLGQVLRSTGPEHVCPLCQCSFTQRKALNRHLKVALQQWQGPSFVCGVCWDHFSRKDVLTRHEAHQHGRQKGKVQCRFCHRFVKLRSLKGHQESQACKDALRDTAIVLNNVHHRQDESVVIPQYSIVSDSHQTAGDVTLVFPRSNTSRHYWESIIPIPTSLQGPRDFILLTARLFTKIQPWGRGKESETLWYSLSAVPQSNEIDKLKSWIFPSVREALASPGVEYNAALFDALALLMICINMIDGWAMTPPHQTAVIDLADRQIRASSLTKDAFLAQATSEPFYSVLFDEINEAERQKCEAVIHLTTVMIRDGGYKYTARLTDNHRRPLEHRAALWHSYRHLTPERFLQDYGTHCFAIGQIVATIGDTAKA